MYILIKKWLDQQEAKSYAEAEFNQLKFRLANKRSHSDEEDLAGAVAKQAETVNKLFNETEALAKRIAEHPEAKQYADNKLLLLGQQLSEIIGKLHPNVAGTKIDPNQGLIIDNYLFQKIYDMLETALTSEYGICETPRFMFSLDSTLNEGPLRNYLIAMKTDLATLQPKSFLDLHSYLKTKAPGFFDLAHS